MATSASMAREKTSQNKRKFRADSPSPRHFSEAKFNRDLASGAAESEGLDGSTIQKSMGALSIGGAAADSGTRDTFSESSEETSGGASYVPDQIERLRRWARAVQARGETLDDGSMSEAVDEDEEEDDEEEDEEEEEDELEEEREWNRCSEGELEDLLMKSLEAHYNEAVSGIMAQGFSKDEALKALSNHVALHGGRIVLSYIVEDSLTYLTDRGKTSDQRDQSCLDLKILQRLGLSNMLFELQKNRPALSRGDAMWCLLMSDLNIEHALSFEEALPFCNPSIKSNSRPGPSLPPSTNTSATTSPMAADPLPISETVPFPSVPPPPNHFEVLHPCSPPSELVASSICSRSPSPEVLATDTNHLSTAPFSSLSAVGDATSESMGQPESSPLSTSVPTMAIADLSQVAGSALTVEDSTREEAESRTQSVRGLERLQEQGKESGLSVSSPAKETKDGLHQENISSRLLSDEVGDQRSEPGAENQPESVQPEVPLQVGISSQGALTVQKPVEDQVGAEVFIGPAETDSSSSVCTPSESSHGTDGRRDDLRESLPEGGNVTAQDNSFAGVNDIEARRVETLLRIRVRDLETQVKDRTEWAQQKVMQAARRLSKDLHELKSLRAERDEALRVKKDQKALEDSTLKKLTEMEMALRKASGQVDRANAAVRRLENENAEVRAEMEAAKLSAAESVATYQEAAKREKKGVKRAQGWEKQKAKLQEDLSEEKRKLVQLQHLLAQAKERQQQTEVRRRQEEKAKDEAIARADNEKRAKEQAETAFKRREEASRRKAEQDKQRLRDDVERLTQELSSLRAAEGVHLAASSWGSTVTTLGATGGRLGLKEMNERLLREVAELQDLSRRDVRRDRECVMCMCEEMSVVFLPCAHQVVCIKCNELHEKQGMRDCPSCRTPIKQRIRVYGASF